MTGPGVPVNKGAGKVLVFDLKEAAEGDMEPVYEITAAERASAVCMFWHPNIQQIAVRVTGLVWPGMVVM